MYDMYTVTDAAANLLFLNSKWIADERNITKIYSNPMASWAKGPKTAVEYGCVNQTLSTTV